MPRYPLLLSALALAACSKDPSAPRSLLASAPHADIAPTTWKLSTLGVLPRGTYSVAHAINNRGDIVGYGDFVATSFCPSAGFPVLPTLSIRRGAFLVDGVTNGRRLLHFDFGPLFACDVSYWSVPYDISDNGVIVGVFGDVSDAYPLVARLPRATRIPVPLPEPYGDGMALAVNDHDTVVGWYTSLATGTIHGFAWAIGDPVARNLTPAGYFSSRALDIDDDGRIVGTAIAPGGGNEYVVWEVGGGFTRTGVLATRPDPRTPFSRDFPTMGIMTGGPVVLDDGRADGAPPSVWLGRGTVRPLSLTSGAALDVSELGQVVGFSNDPGVGQRAVSGGIRSAFTALPGFNTSSPSFAAMANSSGCTIVGAAARTPAGPLEAVRWRTTYCEPR